MCTSVILLTATDLQWLTPAEDLISYALENWCNFFHSCSTVSIFSWGSTQTVRSAGAEFALNLKSSHTQGCWDLCHLFFTDPQRFPSRMAVGFVDFVLYSTWTQMFLWEYKPFFKLSKWKTNQDHKTRYSSENDRSRTGRQKTFCQGSTRTLQNIQKAIFHFQQLLD